MQVAVQPISGSLPQSPVAAERVTMLPGFWRDRLVTNETSIRHAYDCLDRAGNFAYLHAAAEQADEPRLAPFDHGLASPNIFDSDVYKWLEAVAWHHGSQPSPGIYQAASSVVGLVESAQAPDGYLGSWAQTRRGVPWSDWRAGHEFYNGGHLIQAGIAWRRATDDDRLFQVALRYAEHVCERLRSAYPSAIPAHPGIEMALAELFRETADERFLDEAKRLLDLRGRRVLGHGLYTDDYFLDDLPVREARSARGHAVMFLYLMAGAVDVAVETDDLGLLAAARAQFEDLLRRKSYVTGAVGSRHFGEAIGDAYELPPDRAYAETCAAAANVMLCWRLLLATDQARYAAQMERLLYNALLVGVSLDGRRFSYDNPLRVRGEDERVGVTWGVGRQTWFECACCPPNLMRTVALAPQFIFTTDHRGISVQQYVSARVRFRAPDGSEAMVSIDTDLPWGAGTVEVRIDEANGSEWRLRLRLPEWARHGRARMFVQGRLLESPEGEEGGYLTIERSWRAGDRVELELRPEIQLVTADHRIEALAGVAALQRGPVIYCLEAVDLPDGIQLAELALRPDDVQVWGPDPSLGGALTLAATVTGSVDLASDHLYRPIGSARHEVGPVFTTKAVPYHLWGNRGLDGMRLWLSLSRSLDGD